MKTLLALLLLVSTPVFAGTTITITVGSGVSEVWTLSDTDQQKFEAWVQYAYKCTDKPDCAPFTLAESEALWAKATLQGTVNNVTNFQDTVAAKIAVEATTPVGFSVSGTDTKTKKK